MDSQYENVVIMKYSNTKIYAYIILWTVHHTIIVSNAFDKYIIYQ